MKCRCSRLATAAVVPVPSERVEHDVARRGAGEQHAVQQRLGLLRRMQLQAVLVAQPLGAGAQRDQPVAAHLDVVVQRLHGLVVELVAASRGSRAAQISVSCALVKRRPRKFGIGLDLRQITSFRIQNPRSCRMAPMRKMLW